MKFNKIALIAASALAMAAATSANATVTISGAGKFDASTPTIANISSSLGAFIYSFDVADSSSTTVSNWVSSTITATPVSVAFASDSFTLTFTGGTTLKFGGVAGLVPFTDGFGAFAQSLNVNGVNHLFATSGSSGTNVRVDVSAVPEPATWALMLGGFGLAGFALRSRSKARVSYAA